MSTTTISQVWRRFFLGESEQTAHQLKSSDISPELNYFGDEATFGAAFCSGFEQRFNEFSNISKNLD
jgi:hypothetical protein